MIRFIYKIWILWNIIKVFAQCGMRIRGYKYLRIKGSAKLQISRKRGRMIVDGRLDLVGGRVNPLSKGAISHIRIDNSATLKIGKNVRMSSVSIWAKNKITIGDFVTIGANTSIIDSNMHDSDHLRRRKESLGFEPKSIPVEIGDDVFIGMNCVILKGVKIGRAAIISANSVVFKDVPDGVVWKGTDFVK